jgi:UDP-N-acetylglucosamine diphosphorylase / glucose-1-phosphate thymidylyltransferase / UDP-N-acetylgalactosamine diphosphorylase / glucosamine-1-phosphate N-acetyltransferase / galactosamine-1-phosphate N-acetyltransferase
MSDLFLYDDVVARTFEPFALTRPVSELRAGALLMRERWEHALGLRAAGVVSSPHLVNFEEPWAPGASVLGPTDVIPSGSVLASSRCAVALAASQRADSWRCSGRVAAVTLSRDVDAQELASGQLTLDSLAPHGGGGRVVELQGRWIDHVWDFIAHLSAMLTEDVMSLAVNAGRTGPALGMIGGPHPVFAEDGATVEPQVYFDTTAGPVLVRRGATVQAFTRIAGPCVVGQESLVGGDKISGSSIGDTCKVHGEMSATILLGHSNKGHDGFVGHSYFGRWVNLGAGTITSNLKNTYGTVQLWTPAGERETGLQFLGTFFGDHAKTGIGTSLTTGTVIGAGANIYGAAMPPKAVAPFAWGAGAPYSTYRLDKFIEVARRAMSRRHVDLSSRQIQMLTAAFERRWNTENAK